MRREVDAQGAQAVQVTRQPAAAPPAAADLQDAQRFVEPETLDICQGDTGGTDHGVANLQPVVVKQNHLSPGAQELPEQPGSENAKPATHCAEPGQTNRRSAPPR